MANVEQLVFMTSLFGAALFFAAGFLAARRRVEPAVAFAAAPVWSADLASAPPGPGGDAPSSMRIAVHEAEVRRLSADLHRAECRAADRERERDAALARSEAQAREASRSAADDRQRLLRAEARAAELEAARAKAEDALVRAERALAEETQRRDEEARLRQDAEARERAAAERVVPPVVQAQRERELEHLRDENARLRPVEREVVRLRERAQALEAELARSKAAGLLAPRSLGLESKPPPAVPATASFRTMLATLTKSPSLRAAVLADEMGLVVDSAGDHAEALAALSGVLLDVGARAQKLLPLLRVRRVVLEDEQRVTVTSRPFAAPDGVLSLVTLTLGPGPDIDPAARRPAP
jgi:hypothetical protein